MLTLRGHQQENFDELSAHVAESRNPLLVAPCGYGKGVLISHIVESALRHAREGGYSVSIIFGVHGISLVADMSQRLTRASIPHGVLMGGARRQRWHPVQVASLDTLARMTHPPACDIFIVDEAHLALAPIWKKTIERFPGARIIGMTATPVREDGRALGKKAPEYQHPDKPNVRWDGIGERPRWLQKLDAYGIEPITVTGGFFDVMVLGPSVAQLIHDGYLVRSRVLEPPAVEGAAEIKTKGGDDKLAQQAAVFDKVKLIGDEVEHYKRHASGRKGVTFGADQKHAAHIAEAFTAAGMPWVYVDANTPMGDPLNPAPGTRAAIWRDLDAPNGNLMGVSNCGITKIGWDHSIVSYLGIMRRFGSFGEWHQVQGRGSRLHPGKEDFLIIDHGGSREFHGDLGYFESEIEWSLDGEAVKPCGKKEKSVRACKNSCMNCPCGKPVQLNHEGQAEPGFHDLRGVHWPCYGTFPSGPDECPWCACPVLRKSRKVETVGGELAERVRIFAPSVPASLAARVAGKFRLVSPPMVSQATAAKLIRRDFEFLLNKARAYGRKPGWAKHVYEARTGNRVPVEWMPAEWRAEKGL